MAIIDIDRGLAFDLGDDGVIVQQMVGLFGPRLGSIPYALSSFETQSPIGEDRRKKLVDFMLSRPENGGYQLFRMSENLRQISDDVATHKALETMYIGPKQEPNETGFTWARLFIENIHNSMAVRNRLRIVKEEFRDFVGNTEQEQVNVLSIAAGSSRGLLEETSKLPRSIIDRINLKLIDISPQAGEDARVLSQQLGVADRIETVTGNVLKVNGYLEEGYRADFIEVVGLMDYLKEGRHVVNLLKRLKNHLTDGGMILFSNIMPNDERDFTHKIVGWLPMQYRSAEELENLAKEANFLQGSIRIRQEPLAVYNIVCATLE